MALITMWRHSTRQCFIAVDGLRSYTVQIVDGGTLIREERVASADDAVLLAQRWGLSDE